MYKLTDKQEAFEKCWTHSLLHASRRPPIHQVSLLSHVARRLLIDVHDDDDNQGRIQRGDEGMHPPPAYSNFLHVKNIANICLTVSVYSRNSLHRV